MAADTYGFREHGFVRPGAVRFGWRLDGTGEEMDGFFALDTGGDSVSIGALLNEPRLPLD